MEIKEYTKESVELLKHLIETPSVSRNEKKAADIIEQKLNDYGFKAHREANNVWAVSPKFDETLPTILLNAHIDTVEAVKSWNLDPFRPFLQGDRLYGLGTNDCGGGLVSLLQAFRILIRKKQSYNIVYLASAEEEVSGKDGFNRVLPLLPKINIAIVGEPTDMQPAVAEKGLMVLDLISHGKSGHAARDEGKNAIYEALDDIEWIRNYKFQKVSKFLGPVKMQLTVINAGTQHNVVPDECHMLVDVRPNELYSNEEVYNIIRSHVHSDVNAHSFRLSSSHIDISHPLIYRCMAMGMHPFGSPTVSDQALMPFPSFKLGPGDSARSHTADEFICITEIDHAISTYIKLLDGAAI